MTQRNPRLPLRDYTKLAEADTIQALECLVKALRLDIRFDTYVKRFIVSSERHPGLYGSARWVLCIHSAYKLRTEYKSAWDITQTHAHWFLAGYKASQETPRAI